MVRAGDRDRDRAGVDLWGWKRRWKGMSGEAMPVDMNRDMRNRKSTFRLEVSNRIADGENGLELPDMQL